MNATDASSLVGAQNHEWMGLMLPGVALLAIGAFTLVALAFTVHRKSVGWGVATGLSFILLAAGTVVGGVLFARAFQKQAARSSQIWVVTSEDGQHQFKVPGHWKQETELGEDPAIQVANRLREQYMMLFAYPRDGSVSLRDWAATVNKEIGANVKNAVLSDPEERTIGGFPARFSHITGKVDGIHVAYHITYLELPDDFAYVLCWTLKGRERQAFPVFDSVVKTYTYTPAAVVPQIPYDKSAPVAERVRVLIANALGTPLDQVTPDAQIKALGADELDVVELVMSFEEEFHGEISDEIAAKLVTVADVVRWAESQQKETETAPESVP